MLLLAGISACSPQRRYKVLSFFFDGVPDPNAPRRVEGEEGDVVAAGTGGGRAVAYFHKPYKENKCDACHGSVGGTYASFTKPQRLICLKCHEQVPTQYRVMHGPVAQKECNFCHVPHESSVQHLLKKPSPDVCTQCHERELLSTRPPGHQIEQASCLDCHVAHGGEQHNLLRPGITITTMPPGMSTTAPSQDQTAPPAVAPGTGVP